MAVQPEQFAGYEELSRKIEAGTAAGRYIVAIDGRCGAGKSTLAQQLARDLGGRVVCADDFFLRPEQRTPERLAEPGGNLDRERMKSEVIDRLSADALSYTPFDCGVMDFGSPVELPPARLTIVEGAYSLHPYFGEYYDLAVFVTADPETRLARIGARPGHNNVEMFRKRWIPMEERYLSACEVETRSNLVIDTTK